jgi:hypothetical protein
MSMQHVPYRVDWEKFLNTFPNRGEWTKPCRTKLKLDNDAFSQMAREIYLKSRKRLAAEVTSALDQLLAVVSVNGFPKRKNYDLTSVYVPHCKFNKDDFQYCDEGYVVPRSSPEQVTKIIAAFDSVDLKSLESTLATTWDDLETYPFESANEYIGHVKNWLKILLEIQKHEAGLMIDLS